MKNSFARNLLISTILWIVFVVFAEGLERLLLISIFLAIPILLFLVPTTKRNGSDSRYHSFLMGYHPYAACSIGLAFAFPEWNTFSGVFSIPWAIYLLALAGYGIRRLLERGWYVLEENAIDCGLIYSSIGGIVLSIYCFGGHLPGNHSDLLLGTAAHFHFVAIFSPVFIGLVGRFLGVDTKFSRLYFWTTIGLISSPLLVAIGIYTNHIVEVIATTLFGIFLSIYSYIIFAHISKRANRFIASLFLQASAVVLLLTIILTIVFNISSLLGKDWLTIEQIKVFHGLTDAIGFVLLGLLSWLYLKPVENTVLYGLPHSNINGEKEIGKDFFDRKELTDCNKHHAGLVDSLQKFTRNDFFPCNLHPKIRSFYENTMLYDLAAQVTWHRGFRTMAKVYKKWSNKAQQNNFPTNQEEIVQLDSKIIGVCNKEQYWNKNLRSWILSYRNTDQTMSVAIYSDHNHDNEQYLNVTVPIPKWNITSIFRMEHGIDLSLQTTSLPRRGRKGDEGIYLMIKNFSLRLPINQHFLLWVDEYGRLQATERLWLFGLKLMSIEYEISGKSGE